MKSNTLNAADNLKIADLFLLTLQKSRVATHKLPLFDLIGFAAPQCVLLPNKLNSGMSWLDSTLSYRRDSLSLLSWARSFIVVGLIYANKIDESLKKHKKYLRIADYGVVRDYHRVIREKLRNLIKFIAIKQHFFAGNLRQNLEQNGRVGEKSPPTHHATTKFTTFLVNFMSYNINFQYKIFVDSFPISEKGLARAAFGGTIGKNQLFHSALGSKILLAGAATNIPLSQLEKLLSYEELLELTFNGTSVTRLKTKVSHTTKLPSEHKLCTTCNLCITRCPTGALQPKRLKVNNPYANAPALSVEFNHIKCISYLTIENKRPIPPYIHKRMKNWLFGCDDCQDICPYNKINQLVLTESELTKRFGKIIKPVLYAPKAGRFSYHGFKQYFKGTPVLRQRFAVFKNRVNWYIKNIL